MSELTARSGHEQEWPKAQAHNQAEHQKQRGTENSLNDPTLLVLGSHRITGRGNSPLRITLAHGMQQTHGNRAVQRAIHVRTSASQSSLLSVQRDDFTSTFEDEEFMSVADEGVCYPEEEEMPAPAQSGNISGAATSAGAMPTAPTFPGPYATEQQMLQYQMEMQKYSRMMDMMSKIMQSSHEMKKGIIGNLRS
jgi:hypothetical protein